MDISAHDIVQKLASLGEKEADLHVQFRNCSVLLLMGDTTANEQIIDIQQSLDRLKIDREILKAGLASAHAAEQAERDREMAERRGGVIKATRKDIEEMIAKCAELDQMRDRYLALASEVGRIEQKSSASLRSVRSMPDGGVIGRQGLAIRACELMSAQGRGNLVFLSDQRGLAEVARIGWAFLFQDQEEDEEKSDEAA